MYCINTKEKIWQQLKINPAASLTGYDPIERVQIRMSGTSILFDSQSDECRKVVLLPYFQFYAYFDHF